MTNREFYVAILNSNLSEDLTSKAQELIDSLDARNEKRKSADSKAKKEVASRKDAVCSSLTSVPQFAETIADQLGLSVGQVRSALSALVRDGIATKAEIKDGKSKKMAYTKA